MSPAGPTAPAGSPPARLARSGWRVWLGLAVTALALYWTLRGVAFDELLAELARTHPGWLALLLPWQILGLWVRAARWRHLAAAIAPRPLSVGPFYRATAVGYLAINLFPLRLGELVRPWFLSRETGMGGVAALGTLVLERAIDFATLALIGAAVLLLHTERLPDWVRGAALVFAGLACVPFLLAVALHRGEAATLARLQRVLRKLPPRYAAPLLEILTQVARGLAALEGRRAITRVALYSLLLWAGVLALPFLIGFPALGIELPPGEALLTAYTAHVFTALAIAAPSAPGFVGVYHFACREALGLASVPAANAVAYGTVLHVAYWIPVTLAGVLVTLRSGFRLRELMAPPGR